MTDLMIKLSLLIVFFAVMVGIGLYCRRHTTDVSGFVLGGRSVGPLAHRLRLRHQLLLRRGFCGLRRSVRLKYGIAATWAGIGNALLGSLLAWAVLGRRTRVMTQHLDSATMPEFFGKRFSSRPLKLGGLGHHLHLPHPLHRQPLQRPQPPVRHGLRHRLLQ